MNFLKPELDSIDKLLFENIDNFKKDIFAFVYEKGINLNLELDNMVKDSYFGADLFQKAMDKSIEKYNNNKVC